MSAQEIPAFDAMGVPLAGLAPAWVSYRNAATGSSLLGSAPAISAVGTKYIFTPDDTIQWCGLVDLNAGGGTLAQRRYVLVFADGPIYVFAAFAAAGGAPEAGLTPVFTELYDVDHALSLVGSYPTITALGDGMYKFTPNAGIHLSGYIDLTAGQEPRYLDVDIVGAGIGGGSGGLVVTNVSPSGGSPLANRYDPISFDVYSSAAAVALVVVTVFSSVDTRGFVVYDGASFVYPFAALSSKSGSGTSGAPDHFVIKPEVGWQDTVDHVEVYAVDEAGHVLQVSI